MEEIRFKSLQELYDRLKPALECRVNEIKRENVPYIKEEDIWNYLRKNKWLNTSNLTLSDMVSDILNVDSLLIDEYIKKNMKKVKREIDIDQNNIL